MIIVPQPKSAGGVPLFAERSLILGQKAFLRTDDGTQQLNVNGSPAGSILIIWNGTGGSDTGGDWIVSGDGSQQAAADAGSGTNGWDSGTVGANSNTLFNNGSLLTVSGVYSTLSFKLNPRTFPGKGQLQIQWRNASGTVIGSTLNIPSYTTNMDLNVWQTVQIPISDFNLTEQVQQLNFVYKVGTQRHYIDDIQLQSSGGGGPYTFEVSPDSNTEQYHLTMLVILVSGSATGWNPNTFANITALTNGLLLRQRRKSDSSVLWSLNSKDNTDLFGRYHPQDDIEFADGSLLVGFMLKPGKASVIITQDDVLEIVVRDNLSSLTSARAFAHYGVEVIG